MIELENAVLVIVGFSAVYILGCALATVFCRDSVKQLIKEYFESKEWQDNSHDVEKEFSNKVIKVDNAHTLEIVFQKDNSIFGDNVPIAKITFYPAENNKNQSE